MRVDQLVRRALKWRMAAAVTCGWIFPAAAFAFVQLTVGGNCTVSTSVDNLPGESHTEYCNRGSGMPVTAPFTFSDGRDFGNIAASFAAGGDYGALGLQASANATAVGTPANSGFQRLFARGEASLTAFDTLTPVSISGSSVAGSPISITMTMRLHGASTVGFETVGDASGTSFANYQAGLANDTTTHLLGHDFDANDGSSTFDQTLVIFLVGLVGDEMEIFQSFNLSTQIDARTDPGGSAFSAASIDANYLNTADLFFSVSDPDIRLVSGSGHDYRLAAAAIPEPWTPLLLVLGGMMLGCFRLRGQPGPGRDPVGSGGYPKRR